MINKRLIFSALSGIPLMDVKRSMKWISETLQIL